MQPEVGTVDEHLLTMQALDQRLWSPYHRRHVGQLAWSVGYAEPQVLDAGPVALWEDDGLPVAWAWAESSSWLEICVDPARPELAEEAVRWFARGSVEVSTVLVMECDSHLAGGLSAHGFAPLPEAPFFEHLVLDPSGLPEVPEVAGYRFRAILPGEESERAACHRDAWSDLGSSNVTGRAYERLVTLWPYRHELDWVAVDESGAMVASCLLWYDEGNGSVLLEPVGCAPEHRRRGLARAVSIAALHAARDLGATQALVCPRGDDAYPAPRAVYGSIGFRPVARTVTWQRTAGALTPPG